MFFNVLQTTVLYCVVPIMYVVILTFAFLIIRATPTPELRVRSLIGVLAGILFALAFVIVDLTATGLAQMSADPSNILIVVPFGIVSAVVGFFVLLIIDLFLRRGAASFVVFFLVSVSLISAYFLVRANELRSVISLSTVTFLFGNIIYVMMNFNFVKRFINLGNTVIDENDENRWKL